MNELICPVCKQILNVKSNSYICSNNHTYDRAKQGYVNLLQKQGGKTFGDSKEMIQARKYIQNRGLYNIVSDTIIEVIKKLKKNTILDIGCGIGFYTNKVQQQYKNIVYGIDISKDAIKEASKQSKDIQYIVGSNSELPILDQSIDLILNVFSPIYIEEALRVLKKDGHIVVVSPNKDHLIEMKEIIYDSIIDKKEERNDLLHSKLELSSERNITYKLQLNKEEIHSIFMMTPHYWTSSMDGKKRLSEVGLLDVTIAMNVKVYTFI